MSDVSKPTVGDRRQGDETERTHRETEGETTVPTTPNPLPTTQPTVTDSVLARIIGSVRGEVVLPSSPTYDDLRRVEVGGVDARPVAIVRVQDADDVAGVVRIAREAGIGLAVRSGGHGAAGPGAGDGAIVVDVRGIDDIDVDVEGRTAWAGTGLTTGRYTARVARHGLATGFGDTGSVGLSGITLGGGVGYLSRKHGLTIDSLLAAEIVTADGVVRVVDTDHDPDLFWALRGGGGNVGIVTHLRFRLHEVEKVLGGPLVLPATPAVLAGFVRAALDAPPELTTIANVMPCPPLPGVPPEMHGRVVVMATMAYAGDLTAGEEALTAFRSLAPPLADLVQPMPYSGLFPDEGRGAPTAVYRNVFRDGLAEDAAAEVLTALEDGDAAMRVVQLRPLGGAVAQVARHATAYAHRDRALMVHVVAVHDGPEDRPRREAWVTDLAGRLTEGPRAAYVNFVGDEGEDGLHAAYPEPTLRRLRDVKRRHDPDNVFRFNHNVAP